MNTKEKTKLSWPSLLEEAIVGKLVLDLIDNGYRVELSDQDGGGLFVYAGEDGEQMPADGWKHWVRLVPGNGADVIVDYTTSLEKTLKDVNEFAGVFRE